MKNGTKVNKHRQQFNFSLNLKDPEDKKQFETIEDLMRQMGLNRANLIHMIVVQSLPEFAKKHLSQKDR